MKQYQSMFQWKYWLTSGIISLLASGIIFFYPQTRIYAFILTPIILITSYGFFTLLPSDTTILSNNEGKIAIYIGISLMYIFFCGIILNFFHVINTHCFYAFNGLICLILGIATTLFDHGIIFEDSHQ